MVQCLLFKKEKTLHNISEVVKFKRTPNVHKPIPKHASPSTAVEEGIIRAVPSDKSLLKLVHYLYHNALVCQDKSTTKGALCVSCLCVKTTKHDCLWMGPKFNQLIIVLLVKFIPIHFHCRFAGEGFLLVRQ